MDVLGYVLVTGVIVLLALWALVSFAVWISKETSYWQARSRRSQFRAMEKLSPAQLQPPPPTPPFVDAPVTYTDVAKWMPTDVREAIELTQPCRNAVIHLWDHRKEDPARQWVCVYCGAASRTFPGGSRPLGQ